MRRLPALAVLVALCSAGCGIKGPPRPPVQVVQPPEDGEQKAGTPPRPDREETGVEPSTGPTIAADAGTEQGDGGAVLAADAGTVQATDAGSARAGDAGTAKGASLADAGTAQRGDAGRP